MPVKAKRNFYASSPADTLREMLHSLPSNSTVTVGIDPGVTGAVSFLGPAAGCVFDIPVFKTEGQSKRKGQTIIKMTSHYDLPLILEMFAPLREIKLGMVIMAVERTSARPGDSPVTAFSMGMGWGIWQLFAADRGYVMEDARPSTWKKAMGLPPAKDGAKDMHASRLLAGKLRPSMAAMFTTQGDHNRAEAVLIGEYVNFRRAGTYAKG